MKSIKFASQSGCDYLPWESEQEIQENASEIENKWFQPSIARSSRYKDTRWSSEVEEDDKHSNQTGVFSRLGHNASRNYNSLPEQVQAISSLTVRNGEKRKVISFSGRSTSSSTALHLKVPQIDARRPHPGRERSISCGACKKGGRPRACRHHIKDHESSRSQFQQGRVGRFEDQQSESKPFRDTPKDVNLFRSGTRIYGGLGRHMDWTSHEETCRKEAENFSESDEGKPRNSSVISDKNASELNEKKCSETSKVVDMNVNQNLQEGNLLNDIFTSFSDELSDDFDDKDFCLDKQNLHNQALQSLRSDTKRKDCSQDQSVTGCSNHEEDSAQPEIVRNNPQSKFDVNKEQSTETIGLDSSDVQIHVVDDLEEGEIVGASYIGVRIDNETNVQIDEVLCKNINLAKFHSGNSRGLFESERLKLSSQATHGEKQHTPVLPKRTRKSDFMCRDSTGYQRSPRAFVRSSRSFQRASSDVRVGGKSWDTDIDKTHGHCKTVLTDTVSRNGFTALDVEINKQEHDRDLGSPNKSLSRHIGKENVGTADYGFTNDPHRSKFDRYDQQRKSFSMEFKEKCSIKPSAKRELVLESDQIIKPPENQSLSNRKFEMMVDDDVDLKSKEAKDVQRAMGECNMQSGNLLQVETHGQSQQVVRENQNPSSPLRTWRRASKVAKIAEGYPHHGVSKEMPDSNEDSHDAAVPCKSFVDFSEKFKVKRQPCIQKKPKEQDSHRLNQRLRQINFGKNTLGYERYLDLVPRFKRVKSDPHTPDIHQVCSKRSWDGQVSKWRRCLHFYDPPVEEDEEFPEAIGIKENNVEVHEQQKADDSIPEEEQEVKDNDLSIYGDWMDFGPVDEELFQDTGMIHTSDEQHNQ